ncbi:MAG: succinate dehydrogenase/fumarate reductase iron-sulfur subunit [Candidatus Lokiarchaeota archaeon]|nr:succinate dehydrogenase/fumarate reductase iron-sulfur subunit [Candidatus Lokiarchaeota archaeon]
MQESQTFLIYRLSKKDGKPNYERFSVPTSTSISILDALFYIQDWYDSTLSFRYSCRGAICGSCGVTIDKVPSLACRTQIATAKSAKKPVNLPEFNFGDHPDWDPKTEILIEPLPNMNVLKDLVVDMDPFWKFYKEVEPFFTRGWNDKAPESSQSPNQMKSIEKLVYCILCGLCWACPVSKENPNYLGPAQLAKADRFIRDSRLSDSRKESVLSRVLQNDAVPACEKYFVCNRVCPKGVMPGTAIKDIRDNWIEK